MQNMGAVENQQEISKQEPPIEISKKRTKPQVLMEYSGPGKENEQDVFLLLRPETNNYKIESSLLSVFRYSEQYNKTLWIRYLANLPGEFIMNSKMILHHYETRAFFARFGKSKFTETMKRNFEAYFKCKFEDATILGAFSAVKKLPITPEQLFNQNAIKKDWLKTHGQDIKRMVDKDNKEVFVVNGDIPKLLTRNYRHDDCAVVMFRTTLDYKTFNSYIKQVYTKLVEESLVSAQENEEYAEGSKKAFHYSKGPFEQIRDAFEYLYTEDGERVPSSELTFTKYLLDKGITPQTIDCVLRNPLGSFVLNRDKTNSDKNIILSKEEIEENSLFELTLGSTYEQAYQTLLSMKAEKLTYEKKRRF